MNNKKLLIVFVALIGIYFIYLYMSGDSERSFRSDIVNVDTEEVTQILLYPKAENYEKVTISKTGDDWQVSKGTFTAMATESAVNTLLNEIKTIKAKRVATKNPDKWSDFQVDSTGNRIQVFVNDKAVADIIVGKFDINQQARTFTSYVRLNNENNVYAIDGFLSTSANPSMDAFRDKKIINFNAKDITEFEIRTEAGIQNYSKLVGNWSTGEGIVLDSTKVETYLNGLSNLNGQEFINDFSASTPATKTATFKGNNIAAPIVVECYDHDGGKPFVFHSSLNPEAYFLSDSSGVYAKLFKSVNDFIPESAD